MTDLHGISDQLLQSLVPSGLDSFRAGQAGTQANLQNRQQTELGQQNIDQNKIVLAQAELTAKGQEANSLLTFKTPEELRSNLIRRAQDVTRNPTAGIEAADLIDMANRLGEPNGFNTIQNELRSDVARIQKITGQLNRIQSSQFIPGKGFATLTTSGVGGLVPVPGVGETVEEKAARQQEEKIALAEERSAISIAEARQKAQEAALGKGAGELATKPLTEAAIVTAKGEAEQAIPLGREERAATQKINVKRLGELSQGSKARKSSINKAQVFLDAFEKGEASSGASRRGFAFIPGVFTSQAAFDERFNAFAEVAAREKLKASGETRPTDADVQGMKNSIFGVGRDESTNIQLLQEFISDQGDLDVELGELRRAKDSGQIDTFTGVPTQAAPSEFTSSTGITFTVK